MKLGAAVIPRLMVMTLPTAELAAPRSGFRFAARLMAILVSLPVAALSVFRAIPAEWPTPVVQLLSFTPWLVLPAAAAAVLAVLGRKAWAIIIAAGLFAVQLFWLFPLDAGRHVPGRSAPTVELTVMNINSEYGEADAREIVRLVRENGVGLLTVQEHSQALEDRLTAEGIGTILPNRISDPTDDAAGSAIYSVHSLQPVGEVPDSPFQMTTVRVTVRQEARTAVLETTNVHTLPPVDVRVEQWRSDLLALGRVAGRSGNQLLIGDFNATYDHSEFRQLLSQGPADTKMVDVGTATGSRLLPTWPMEGPRLPGIVIDHVVTSPQVQSSEYSVHRVPGSDHAAIIATLLIPAAG